MNNSVDKETLGAYLPLYTVGQITELAKTLLVNPNIKQVEVFGSTARDGFGTIVSLLVVVDEEITFGGFWANVRAQIASHCFGGSTLRELRFEAFVNFMRTSIAEASPDVLAGIEALKPSLNVFLVLPDWNNQVQNIVDFSCPEDRCTVPVALTSVRILAISQ